MCRVLTEAGLEVHLATLPYGSDVALPDLMVHRVPRLPGIGAVPVGFSGAKLLYDLLLAGAVLGLLARHRFVAVHAIEEAAFYAIPLARPFGVAGIADIDSDLPWQLRDHASWLARWLARPAGWLQRRTLRHAAGAISVARHMTELARSINPHLPVFEIKDIPLEAAQRPPDPERMAAYRRDLKLEDRRLLVYTGNYDRRQGLEELVRALPAVLDRHPAAALLVVGGEPAQVQALQARVDAAGPGLAAAVRLIGHQPPETMAEYMGLAEVLVSPRLERYATPLKIFSYMASGRPIVATDLPTHNQVLDGAAALLVPPTSEGLAAGICATLDDPAAAARRAARASRPWSTRCRWSSPAFPTACCCWSAANPIRSRR
jgi:glycosyltransferase involved in cell wall biosynthesis